MPRSRAVARIALAVVALALSGASARAQSETAARAVSFDSAALLRRLMRAQRDFERTREANAPSLKFDLPRTCDLQFAAYCHHFAMPDEEAPPEPAGTDQARADLLDALDDGARMLPGDPWIAGQRVRYLVEHGRAGAAVGAARECRAERWWCMALEGFALHAQEDDAAADRLFADALAAMPAAERCAWEDLSPLLDDSWDAYRKVPCEAREATNLRLWWLGRPLYLRSGNDLRVEHYAREVMARIMTGAGLDAPVVVNKNLAELILRYGWPVTWVRAPRRLGDAEPGGLVTRMRTPAWSFFPSRHQPPSWDLAAERAASLYAPTWTTTFAPIEHLQIARFRRGDSVVTVAGFDLSADTALAGQIPRVALVVGSDAASPLTVSPPVAGLHGAVAVQSADPPALVSLEAMREEARWAARFRSATADPTAWLTSPLSDILLVRPEAASSGEIEPLTGVTLPGSVLPVGKPVGVYWEWYDQATPGTTLATEARVSKVGGRNPPDPLAHPDCGPREKAAIAVQWRETVGRQPSGSGRAVALDLSRLPPGRYLIAIAVARQGAADPPRCTSREILLVGR